jgi:hypothetical protein
MKTILMTIMAAGILITSLIFAAPFSRNLSDTSKKSELDTICVIKFHIVGCDNCNGLQFCIDGGALQTVNVCAFTVDLALGNHTICVTCPNNKRGYLKFNIQYSQFVQDVYVYVYPDTGSLCNCANSKN